MTGNLLTVQAVALFSLLVVVFTAVSAEHSEHQRLNFETKPDEAFVSTIENITQISTLTDTSKITLPTTPSGRMTTSIKTTLSISTRMSTTTAMLTTPTSNSTTGAAPNEKDDSKLTIIIIGSIFAIITVLVTGGLIFWFVIKWKNRLRTRVGHSKQFVSPLNKIIEEQDRQERGQGGGLRKIKLTDFHCRTETMHRDGDFMFQAEFERLDEITPNLPNDRTTLTAMQDENAAKNRFIDILPFENNHRVRLQDGGSEYINASYIDGYARPREYIATQGPLSIQEEQKGRRKKTIEDFWRMIWQEKIQCIIMLTKCIEQFRPKCAQYWPTDVKDSVHYGHFKVTLANKSDRGSYIIHTIAMEHLHTDDNPLCVTHWYYPNWPDMRHTAEENLINFVETVRYSGVINNKAPVVVHCSAGVGRTGSYIALDCLLQHIRDHDCVDIFGCVYALRTQRPRMVQTLDQYILLYDCLDIKIQKKMRNAERETKEDGLPQHEYENISLHTNDETDYESITLDTNGDDRPNNYNLTFGIPKTSPLNSEQIKDKLAAASRRKDYIAKRHLAAAQRVDLNG